MKECWINVYQPLRGSIYLYGCEWSCKEDAIVINNLGGHNLGGLKLLYRIHVVMK